MANKRSAELPTRKQILDFISNSDQPAGKREVAKAFAIRGDAKIALKKLLNDMADEGLIESSHGRAFNKIGGVPKVTVLKIVDVDDSGRIFAKPEHWEAETPPPRILVIEKGRRTALGVGERILARTDERKNHIVAHPLKNSCAQDRTPSWSSAKGRWPLLAHSCGKARAPRASRRGCW